MMKRFALGFFAFVAVAFAPLASVQAAPSRGYTLIVAPARYSVLQVAFDMVQRHSAVLVSYQGEGSTPEPRLHAWNGQEWVKISLADYREVNFLQTPPARTVLIGDQQTLPAVLVDASAWSPQVTHVTGLETSTLVNEFGRLLQFKEGDWKWFASRYNLDLRDENAERRTKSWYDQPGPLRRDGTAAAPASDDAAPVAAATETVLYEAAGGTVAVEPMDAVVTPEASTGLPEADTPAVE